MPVWLSDNVSTQNRWVNYKMSGGLPWPPLPALLEINGIAVLPSYRYRAADADASDWDHADYGEVLTAAGSGGTFGEDAPYSGGAGQAFDPAGTRYYIGATNIDLATEDYVLEVVFKKTASDFKRLFSFVDGSSLGIELYQRTSGALVLAHRGASATVFVTTSALTNGNWYHLIAFGRRAGSSRVFANAVDIGNIGISGTGDLSGQHLSLCAYQAGVQINDEPVAYLAFYKKDSWLDTSDQAALVARRYAML
jgi:hypothetical protein